jgi:hypothetical protein
MVKVKLDWLFVSSVEPNCLRTADSAHSARGTPVLEKVEEPAREHRTLKVGEKPRVVIHQRTPGRIDVKNGARVPELTD